MDEELETNNGAHLREARDLITMPPIRKKLTDQFQKRCMPNKKSREKLLTNDMPLLIN